jgi:hypothetical protein
MQEYEGVGASYSPSKPQADTVMTTWTQWIGNSEYRYTKMMSANGSIHITKSLIATKASVSSVHHTSSSSKAKSTAKTTTRRKATTPVKAKPKPVPKKPAAPKKVAKPSFTKAKPTPPSAFSFTVAKPKEKEVLVPQPPTPPGPAPTFATKSQVSATRYEYMYGIKDIQIGYNQFQSKSIYVSTPIQVSGNVMSLSMTSIEEHPLFDALSGAAADRQTSVEYYIAPISTNPAPSLDDWMPILPEDQTTVKSELLMFDTARTATLRFPALIGSKETPYAYKNGIKMNGSDWSFADGGYKVQLLVDKDPLAIYTIDYTPNAKFYNPWSLDLNLKGSTPVSFTESFPTGTNHNKTITLSNYPFVNYETINTAGNYDPNLSSYVPVTVSLDKAGIIGPNRTTYTQVLPYDGTGKQTAFTKNITNYKTGINKAITPYSIDPASSYSGFEYYQVGDQLYFGETFNNADIYTNQSVSHGNATITVNYQYLSSQFRVKIILRRNSTDENTLTPIVHEYALKFKVMK